jgi:hypothetical protein
MQRSMFIAVAGVVAGIALGYSVSGFQVSRNGKAGIRYVPRPSVWIDPSPQEAERNRMVEKLLDSPVDVEWSGATREQAITSLLDQAGIRKVFGRETKCDPKARFFEKPVTLTRNRRTVRSVLDELLDSTDLMWRIDDGYVLVAEEPCDPKLETRLLDVTDLAIWPDGRADPHLLCELIQKLVRPENWDVVGGASTIDPFVRPHSVTLLVRSDRHVHEEVEQFLSRLREMGAGTEVRESITSTVPPREKPSDGTQPNSGSGFF